MTRWDRGNLPVVSVVVTRPLMVCVSPVKGLVAVPLHVVVSVISRLFAFEGVGGVGIRRSGGGSVGGSFGG